MLIPRLMGLALVFGLARSAWLLSRLWRVLPRSNADFGLF